MKVALQKRVEIAAIGDIKQTDGITGLTKVNGRCPWLVPFAG